MSVRRLDAAEAIARLADFDAVVDARSESEFAEDRLPGALNWPSLNDEERRVVGTEYKQVSPFAARKHGAVLVARNIARHVETHVAALERGWKPLVYCWRGGQRSGALATVLDQIGFTVHLLDGGYKAFRRVVIDQLEVLPEALDLRVICGRTGSGKSRLLQALAADGAQVLDLETLACHRGSVLGPVPGMPQPSQKGFETALWQALRALDPARPVFVESESRTIGRLRLPETLVERMRAAPCVHVHMPLAARVALLLEDYAHYAADPAAFCARLDALREVRGNAVVERWQAEVGAGQVPAVVEQLLTEHYDPVYLRSMAGHFRHFAAAPAVELADGLAPALHEAAQRLQAMPAA